MSTVSPMASQMPLLTAYGSSKYPTLIEYVAVLYAPGGAVAPTVVDDGDCIASIARTGAGAYTLRLNKRAMRYPSSSALAGKPATYVTATLAENGATLAGYTCIASLAVADQTVSNVVYDLVTLKVYNDSDAAADLPVDGVIVLKIAMVGGNI